MRRKIWLLLTLCPLFWACNDNLTKYVKKQIGTKLVIDELHYKPSDLIVLDSLYKCSQLLITTTVRKDACPSCFFSLMEDMSLFIDSCHTNKLNCLIFASSQQFEELSEILGDYSLPNIFLINDSNGSYSIDNHLEKYTSDFQTFLVDRNKKIILVGNPMLSSKLKKLYYDEITRILK